MHAEHGDQREGLQPRLLVQRSAPSSSFAFFGLAVASRPSAASGRPPCRSRRGPSRRTAGRSAGRSPRPPRRCAGSAPSPRCPPASCPTVAASSGRPSLSFSSRNMIRLSSQTGRSGMSLLGRTGFSLTCFRNMSTVVSGDERLLPGQQFVEDDAERVQVRLVGQVPVALALLRRHVGGRADGAVRARSGRSRPCPWRSRSRSA